MTQTIKKLDKNLINQIAAGEVVERPSSVVKELLENSLDAKSSQITIDLQNGGIDLIRITDNGIGVDKDDFPLLLEKHATSKISSVEELENTLTMGFRGEALASISSVSKFTFKSKPKDGQHAHQIDQNGEISICSLNQGTQVEIKDLFYNVPARREFLKTPNTEYNQILKLLLGYFIAYPEVSFVLNHNSKQIFSFRSEEFQDRVAKVLGNKFTDKSIPVFYESSNLKLSGIVSKPEFCVSKKPEQLLIVNNRPLKPDVFSIAVKNGYGSLIFPTQKPQFILNIQIKAQDVDMNIHPRKLEARFKYQSILFATILKSIRQALQKVSLVKNVEIQKPSLDSFLSHSPAGKSQASSVQRPSSQGGSYNPRSQGSFGPRFQGMSSYMPSNQRQSLMGDYSSSSSNQSAGLNLDQANANAQGALENSSQNQDLDLSSFQNSLRYLGQLSNSYLLFESKDGLTIIDQHAAHEKVKYFEIRNKLKSVQKHTQKLLTPLEIDMSIPKIAILNDAKPVFEKLGFDYDIKQNKVLLTQVPANLVKINPEKLILELIDDFLNADTKNLIELEDIAINYAACRGAIKFGQSMQPLEVQSLLKSLDELKEEKYSCPHGRPSTIGISHDELEKLFLRKK